jgi:cytochrome c55X
VTNPRARTSSSTRSTSAERSGSRLCLVGLVALVLLPLGASLLAACGGGSSVARPSDTVLAQGQDIYNERCAQCHGDRGQGGTGMKLGGGAVARSFPNIADQIKVIQDGRPGTAMPGWKTVLSNDEITAVARYEREVLPGQ